MKKVLYERWKEFARRMIFNGGLGELTEARKKRLWAEVESFIDDYRSEPVDGWDREYCLCDSFHEIFGQTYGMDIAHPYSCPDGFRGFEYDENPRRFYNQLEIVIRASVDAVTDGEGVLGYTVGDLRQMFDGKIPRWITRQYEGLTALTPDAAGVCL
jgi:hypothetical protein